MVVLNGDAQFHGGQLTAPFMSALLFDKSVAELNGSKELKISVHGNAVAKLSGPGNVADDTHLLSRHKKITTGQRLNNRIIKIHRVA